MGRRELGGKEVRWGQGNRKGTGRVKTCSWFGEFTCYPVGYPHTGYGSCKHSLHILGFFFPILPSFSSPIPRYLWKMRNYTEIFPPANPSGLCFLASFYNDYPHCRYSFPFNSWKGEKWLNVCEASSFAFRSGKCNEFHFRSLFSYSLGRIVWAAAVRLYQAWTVSDRYECIYLRFWHLKSSQQNSS